MGTVLVEISDRKRAEAALKEREEEFRAIFENAVVGITKVAPDGKFLKVNPGLCELLGYTESQLLAIDFQYCTHPEDLQKELSCDSLYQAPSISSFSLEKRFIRSDGEVVWTNVTIGLVNDFSGENKYAIGVIADITARKQAEQDLKESQQRFQILAEVSPVAIVRTDVTGNSLYFNDCWRQISWN
ncbi:MAG: PAS domain S-box protein [Calothrix sp. SM1_7_51]|nr:PAS domain S-box protein [Calothrix sp. SM1_7_51]